jgi:3-dehydroquinate dehydratase-2
LDVEISWLQSNHEGELVEAIQGLRAGADGALVNAAAYTHTSLAIRDAALSVGVPFIEVHLTNPWGREEERRRSLLADLAVGIVAGFGAQSYLLALEGMVGWLRGAAPPPKSVEV